MAEKMTADEFFQQWAEGNPLDPNCSISQWWDHIEKVHDAYQEYDPDGAGKLAIEIKGSGPRLTIAEWERRYRAQQR